VIVNSKICPRFGFRKIKLSKAMVFLSLSFWTILNLKYNLALKTKKLLGKTLKLYPRLQGTLIYRQIEKNTLVIKVSRFGSIYTILIVRTHIKFVVITNSYTE
jgi:hypothetical protein